MLAAIALMTGFAVAAPTQASDARRDLDIDCSRPTSTMEGDLCLLDVLADAERVLEATCSQTGQAVLDAGCTHCGPEPLAEAQHRWRAFREADCDLAYAIAADGSGRNQARLDCTLAHTELRIRQLRTLESGL